jgi:hypothetical protein
MASIFEPLLTTKLNGIGIGLGTCRSVIAVHNGRQPLDHAGEGASFRIYLPLAHHEHLTSGGPSIREGAACGGGGGGDRKVGCRGCVTIALAGGRTLPA